MGFHSFYPDTPTSPQNLQFYSVPSSPMQPDVDSRLDDDEFEFKVISRRFTNRCESQQTYPTFWWLKRHDNEQHKYCLSARARSFCSGQVSPLNPPPRIQILVSSSPRSPNSFIRNPFARSCAWNDDFDPFQFALEKVSNETRARMSFHRRSHSYSACQTSGVSHWLDGSIYRNKEHHEHGLKPNGSGSKIFDQGYTYPSRCTNPNENLKPKGPTLAQMMERKESIYSRHAVPNEPIAKSRSKSNPTARAKTKDSWLGRKKKVDHDSMKGRNESSCCTESKMHRAISFLFKMKKSSSESTSWKVRRCLGYSPGSPIFYKVNK